MTKQNFISFIYFVSCAKMFGKRNVICFFSKSHFYSLWAQREIHKYPFNNKTMNRKSCLVFNPFMLYSVVNRTLLLPPFGTSVLEPGFDLRVGHLQSLGEGGSLGRRQILLPVKALLQLTDLQPCERRPRLLLLGRRSVLVWMTYATCHSEG